MTPRLVLASTSPYRRELLEKLGLPFEIVAPGVTEDRSEGESPDTLALRLATEKALAVVGQLANGLVIGSDQVAVLDDEPLGKPRTRENAICQLRRASGRAMQFYTALCVADAATGITKIDLDVCTVVFRTLAEEQIARYVDREQPLDCAGAFKSEKLGIALIERIEGDDPNSLVGLPLIRLIRLLEIFGVAVL